MDTTSPSIPCETVNHVERLCEHYGFTPIGSERIKEQLVEFLQTKISETLSAEPSGRWAETDALRRQLVVREFADGVPAYPYLGILDALWSACRRHNLDLPHLRDSPSWHHALVAAHDMQSIDHDDLARVMLARRNWRQVAVGKAIAGLRQAGYSVGVREGRGYFEEAETAKIMQHIEAHMRAFGTFNVINGTFTVLSKKYDPHQQRYHFPRRYSEHFREPAMPVALILNLCAKNVASYPDPDPTVADPKPVAGPLLLLARDFVAAMDVEPYHIMESGMNWGASVIQFVRDVALYDSMLTLFQWRPSDVPSILVSIFDWLEDADAEARLGWNIRQAALITRRILKLVEGRHYPATMSVAELCWSMPGISPKNFWSFISIVAHDRDAANQDYITPHDYQSLNLWQRPLIRMNDDDIVLLNAAWCAPAFYEAIRSAVRAQFPDQTDNKIGKAFERMVISRLRERGVTTSSGVYRVGNVDGECDLVVESDDTIILFELKKMGLTRQRAGDVLSVLLDLSRSLLRAQAQLAQQELILYEHGALELVSDGARCRIERRGRWVDRVVVTLLDFGALQHRDALQQIMQTMISSKIVTSDPEEERRVREIQKEALRLAQLQGRLHEIRPINGPPLFNCWFLSLSQLLVLLDDTASNETLRDALHTTRHLSFGTLDFYYEYSILRKAKNSSGQETP